MTKSSAIASSLDVLMSSHWLTSSRAPPCAKWIGTVGKRLYVNALTESERLNDTEYRSEACSEAKLIVVRPERTEPRSGSVLGRTYKRWKTNSKLDLLMLRTKYFCEGVVSDV